VAFVGRSSSVGSIGFRPQDDERWSLASEDLPSPRTSTAQAPTIHVNRKLKFLFTAPGERSYPAVVAYVSRFLAETVRRAARTFPAVLVTGARQSGKTTLLRTEFGRDHEYVSLERPDVRARALSDPVGFLDALGHRVILDEVQRAPELLSYIKDRIDEHRQPGQWLMSGSQSLSLMQGVTQTLAGRIAVLTLDPLSTREVKRLPSMAPDAWLRTVFGGSPRRERTRNVHVDPVDWILRGAFPEPRLNPRVDRRLWFAGYVQTYLERDVRDLLRVGDADTFGRFLSLLAARSGGLLNLADLGRDVGASGHTIRSWLSVLEASHVVYLLRPYHRNFGKRLTKSPKIYFLDPGLASFLTGLHDAEALEHGPSFGALFETSVVGEWIKAFRAAGEVPPLYFWRSSSGLEVDIVVERNARLYGIEVKATSTPLPRHAEPLREWLSMAGAAARGVVACRTDVRLSIAPGVAAVPWHLGGI
jgi:uncharacterized protein